MQNKSYNHSGRITLKAPVGGVKSGNFYRFGALFGCAVSSVVEGRPFTLDRDGVWMVPVEAASGDIEIGDQIYWESGREGAEFSNEVTADAVLVGVACGEVTDTETTKIDVSISPFPLTIAAEAVEDEGGADA